jgi:MYXO-CTERM domain-containing protein
VTVPTVTADHPPLAHTGTSPVLPFAGLTLVGLGLALARRRATTWI